MSLLAIALGLVGSSSIAASFQEGVRVESRAFSPMLDSADWIGSLELDPELAVVLGGGARQLTAAYLPRLVVPSVATSLDPELFHAVGLDARWAPSGRITLSTSHRVGYGTATRTVIGRPLDPSQSPELLPPREHLRLAELSSRVEASFAFSRRITLAGRAELHSSGGVDAASVASLPVLWGPGGELSLSWQATRRDVLALSAVASQEWFGDTGFFGFVGAQPSWRRQLSRAVEARLELGVAFVRFHPSMDRAVSENAGLLGRAEIAWRGTSAWRRPLDASLSVRTRPAVRRIEPRGEQRYEAAGAVGGDLSHGVGLSAVVSGTYVPAPAGEAEWLLAVDVGCTKRMGERTRVRAGLRASRERQVFVQAQPFAQVGVFVAFETSGSLDPAAALAGDDPRRISHGR